MGVGSQAVLKNGESFGLLAARVLATDEDMRPGQMVNITGDNMGMTFTVLHTKLLLVKHFISSYNFLRMCYIPSSKGSDCIFGRRYPVLIPQSRGDQQTYSTGHYSG